MSAERIRAALLCAAIAFIARGASPESGPSGDLAQELGLIVSQDADLHGIRTDNPLNVGNWQGKPDWETAMAAELDWYAGYANRIRLSVNGDMEWREASGEYRGEGPVSRGGTDLFLDEALICLDLHEWGLRLASGKTTIRQGPTVLFPVVDFLVKDTKLSDGQNHGAWTTGLSLTAGHAVIEAWISPANSWFRDDYSPPGSDGDEDPMVLAHAAFESGIHRLGALYYHNGANSVGCYYSGQIGDGLIPYAEAAVSDGPLVRPFADELLRSAPDGWSLDATCGASWAPSFAGVTAYVEYRYRSSGYDDGEWDEIRDGLAGLLSPPPDYPLYYRSCGSIASSLPYFDTPTHSFGLRLQNSRPIADALDCYLNAFFLAPDGLYLSGELSLSAIDRLRVSIGATALMSLEDRGEVAWWNDAWSVRLAASWTVRAYE